MWHWQLLILCAVHKINNQNSCEKMQKRQQAELKGTQRRTLLLTVLSSFSGCVILIIPIQLESSIILLACTGINRAFCNTG